jgi:hypothetical protein
MSCHCSPLAPHTASPHYFVVMQDYRSAGQEAVVDPDITRAEVISRLKTREYRDVLFIHEIRDGIATDVTLELIGEARGLVFA